MVFGLFGRSKAPAAPPVVDDTEFPLRSPSPSASTSNATNPPRTPELSPGDSKRGLKRSRSASPEQNVPPLASGNSHLPPTNPAELLVLIKKIPPKTLHNYVVAHIPDASVQETALLCEFFSTLAPPPKLHCVRCHKDFVEVENTDRSCHVPHDDESAEVEYVGNSKSKVPGIVKTTYETLWNCCNRVVEGDGDQGPPDGWCFEGFHTTDIKRARFRADSTPQDDKLLLCARLRCFNSGVAGERHGRSQRAAARKSLKEKSDEEEDYDVRELEREAHALAGDSDVAGSANNKFPKAKKRPLDVVEAEINGESASASTPIPKGKRKAEGMRPKSVAKSKSTILDIPEPPPSLRLEASAGGDVDMDASSPELEKDIKPKPKKPRKPRKSAGTDGGKYLPPKDGGDSSGSEESEKPKRKKAKRKSTTLSTSAT
ncbi:hypothetical protein M0805_004474 [Coniferiporia weirii]|nr:hypothetical protein M0805_004474 [Coniferiporia weirii]